MSKIRWAPGIVSVLPHLRYEIEGELRLQEAAIRLAVVTPRGTEHIVAAERKRRQRLGMAEVAAHESVCEDIISGRWQPEPDKPYA